MVWSNNTTLTIENWRGSESGGGASQLYFGSNAGGLTPQQLSQVRFHLSNGLYAATILATGEVVPVVPKLQFTRNGSNFTLNWAPGSTLQSATNARGPYLDVPGANSPWTVNMNKPTEFFRLRQ